MRVPMQPSDSECLIYPPEELLVAAAIKSNAVLNIKPQDEQSVSNHAFQHHTLQERAARYGDNLNLSEELSWNESKGNEVW